MIVSLPLELWLTLSLVPLMMIVVLAVILVHTHRRVQRLEGDYRRMLSGTAGGSLESILQQHLTRVEEAVHSAQTLAEQFASFDARLQASVQHVGLYRFNPFAESGGDFSFALALADEAGNGFVMCSLHSRRETRFFVKPLTAWISPYTLSTEEAEAVRRARDDDRTFVELPDAQAEPSRG